MYTAVGNILQIRIGVVGDVGSFRTVLTTVEGDPVGLNLPLGIEDQIPFFALGDGSDRVAVTVYPANELIAGNGVDIR